LIEKINNSLPTRISLIPFTGGLVFVVYAFFWPAEYGIWLGTIVKAFRATAGI
jgi:hypothetical protein